jgi:hypothetical protein
LLFSISSQQFLRIRVNGLSFTSPDLMRPKSPRHHLNFASASFSLALLPSKWTFTYWLGSSNISFERHPSEYSVQNRFFLIPVSHQQTKRLKFTKLFKQRNTNI